MFGGEMEQACNTPKLELESTKYEPYMDWVEIESRTESRSETTEQGNVSALGFSHSSSETHGQSHARTRGHTQGIAESDSDSSSIQESNGVVSAAGETSGVADAFPAAGEAACGIHTDSAGASINAANIHVSATGHASTHGTTYNEADSSSETEGDYSATATGETESASLAWSQSHGKSAGESVSRGEVPVTQHRKFKEVSSVTFPGTEEVKERFIARLDYTQYLAYIADNRTDQYRAVTIGLGFYF